MSVNTKTDLLRRAGRRLPGPIREVVWRRTRGRRLPPVEWGNLRRTEPFSRSWGGERGVPVDRIYIERFLAKHAGDVHGDALEIESSLYTEYYGGDRVTTAHVLDVDAGNPRATIVGDLGAPDTLAPESIDCAVLTQTLQFVADAEQGIANVYRALRPAGVLLLTVPGISHLEQSWDDLWRWTPKGFARFLDEALPTEAERELTAHGNVLTSVAFLLGLASEDLTGGEYDAEDDMYPLVLCARIKKPIGS
ncbi:MAG: class I SAM-dependent methyltransferase [Solirubrobacteraceae bacterium]